MFISSLSSIYQHMKQTYRAKSALYFNVKDAQIKAVQLKWGCKLMGHYCTH